jgi:A/G-specific adenine glycosylase
LPKAARSEIKVMVGSRSQKPAVSLPRQLRHFFSDFEQTNARKFPWRSRRTSAYQMLVAEVLLRQTKAPDVVKVWRLLKSKYPTPAALSRAGIYDLRRLLKPLGLWSQRAAALKKISAVVVNEFEGRIPKSLETLLSIPHVGLYASCALLCFKYGIPTPIVDSNILRVFGRITGQDLGRDLRRNEAAWSLAWSILPARRAALHNYGLLDFSALICKPRVPLCGKCPLVRSCSYGLKFFSGDGSSAQPPQGWIALSV